MIATIDPTSFCFARIRAEGAPGGPTAGYSGGLPGGDGLCGEGCGGADESAAPHRGHEATPATAVAPHRGQGKAATDPDPGPLVLRSGASLLRLEQSDIEFARRMNDGLPAHSGDLHLG
jgi:hypothetical protein